MTIAPDLVDAAAESGGDAVDLRQPRVGDQRQSQKRSPRVDDISSLRR
jgi:hypothetical protein